MSEIQSFSTKAVRYEFEVDGVPYFIPGISAGDLLEIARLDALDNKVKGVAFTNFMASRVRKTKFWSKSGRRAALSLDPKQQTALFNAWSRMGRTPGESSASPASA